MQRPLANFRIVCLVAHGFDQSQFSDAQRAMLQAGAVLHAASPENGLVHAWQGQEWGHHFPLDVPIGQLLAADYDALLLPGGSRSVAKLRTSLHTRRIIGSMIDAGKPIAAIADGVGLLALPARRLELMLSCLPADVAELSQFGASISERGVSVDQYCVSGDGSDLASWIIASTALFSEHAAAKAKAASAAA